MTNRYKSGLLATVVALAGTLAPPASAADPHPEPSRPDASSRAECLDAHHSAQELRKAGKLIEAQEQLNICSGETCPGAIITDCGKWLTEIEQATPSLVFEVRVDGKDTNSAQIEVDGHPVGDWSRALKVNPGHHDVRVTVAGFDPYLESVSTPEGQRLKMVSAEFNKPVAQTAPLAATAPPPVVLSRPTPPSAYVLLGAAVLGAGGFATFAAIGKTKQNQLDNDCVKVAPCTDADLKPMKTMYLVGDISAGVGAAALIGAAIVYFSRPTVEAPATSFQVGQVGDSSTSFGFSASRAW